MTIRLVPLVMLILGVSISIKAETVPTLEQCHADKNAWDSQLVIYKGDQQQLLMSAKPTLHSEILQASLAELSRRIDEMATCAFMEAKGRPDYYLETVTRLHEAFMDRYVFFVKRHNLEGQLYEEDAEGHR